MPKQLLQDIKKVELLAIQIIDATAEGSAIDTKLSEGFSFDTALVNVEIGDVNELDTTSKEVVGAINELLALITP